MNCSEAEQLAPLYWSNELDGESRRGVEEHLKSCLECAREWQTQSQFDQLLRDSVGELPDASRLQARVRAQIRGSATLWQRIFASPALRLASAALIIVLLAGGSWFYVSRQQARARTLYSDAAEDHRDEVAQHYVDNEWRYTQPQIEALLQERVADSGLVRRLAPAGYHIDRARLCELATQIYVHLVYNNGQNEVSVFVRRNEGGQLAGPSLANVKGMSLHCEPVENFEVAGFKSQRFIVLVVSALSQRQNLQLASEAAGGV